MMKLLVLGLGVAAAAVTFIVASGRSRRFVPLVIVCAVAFSGIVVVEISYLDELLLGAAVCAVLVRRTAGAFQSPMNPRTALSRPRIGLFLVTCTYMVLQSVRGMLVTGSIQKIRWPLFFVLLALLAQVVARGDLPLPGQRRTALLVCRAGLVYFTVYILVGCAFEYGLGLSRYDIQNVAWGGTSYAAFVLLVVVPAGLLLVRDPCRRTRRLGWLAIGAVIWQAFYYESRSSWEALVILIIVSAPVIRLKPALVFAGAFVAVTCVFLGFVWPEYYSVDVFRQILIAPFKTLAEPASAGVSDFSRYAHTQIGFDIVRSDPSVLFLGTGWRASDNLVSAALLKYYQDHGFGHWTKLIAGVTSTIGFTTVLVECGLIGVLLYLANFLLAARSIVRCERSGFRYVLLSALCASAAWTFVTNPMDIVIFHLMIMPSGLLVMLSSANRGFRRDPGYVIFNPSVVKRFGGHKGTPAVVRDLAVN